MTPLEFIGYARKFCVALTAALAIAAVSMDNGITSTEWINIALAFAGALGVYSVPNDKKITKEL